MLRVYAGGVATETNVFAPMPTGLADFGVARPDDARETRERLLAGSSFARFNEVAVERGCDYVQGSYAFALPAGVIPRNAYETLRDALLAEIEAALPVDCVLLTLHGAMVAEGYADCETDIVERVRGLVGGAAKVGVLLDLHCDLPEDLLEAADVVVIYKEYPHVDIDARSEELATLILDAAVDAVDPKMAVFDCRMMGIYPTSLEPMRAFVDGMSEAERQEGILSVSLAHGFPWGDGPAVGARMLVVSDGDVALADELATALGRKFFALRHSVSLKPLPMMDAIDRALEANHTNGPVVLSDTSDNPGGGAASDSTFILRELLDRKVQRTAVGLIWDPVAVAQAFAAGVGAELTVRLGGKMGPASGDPLDMTARVRGLVPDLIQRWPQTDGYLDFCCGDCACLTCDGVEIVVGSVRHQVFGTEIFTAFGIDPAEQDLVVVKSANHFTAAFGPIASEVIYTTSPGALTFDFPALSYKDVDVNKFPWVDDPWSQVQERVAR